MTNDQLKAELDAHKVEYPKNAKKADLEALVLTLHGAEVGTPHLVTQEDLDLNPGLGDDVKVGDVVILPSEGDDDEDEGDEPGDDEGSTAPTETGDTPTAPVEEVVEDLGRFHGRAILSKRNVEIHGQTWVEVALDNGTTELTTQAILDGEDDK